MTEELLAVLALDIVDANSLYERCYTRDCRSARPASQKGDPDLTAQLAAANQSRDQWDDNWRVVQPLDEGRVLACRGGAARAFRPGQYLTLRGPGPVARKDEPIRVFQAAGTADLQTGFYFAFGETVCDYDEFEDLLRLYWNVSQTGAPALMSAITGEFNRFSVPFRFKCGQIPELYERRDPAVLYFRRRYYPIVAQLVERIHRELAEHLRDNVPLFTRRLACGLGFAEDPGESFGRSRCAILAEAMEATRGKPAEERWEALRGSFRTRKLSMEEPWRNAGSSGNYPFPFTGV
ncbi:MAG TPA: T3SS effector HopA1 family protein [Candidatus Solibacter sp.]